MYRTGLGFTGLGVGLVYRQASAEPIVGCGMYSRTVYLFIYVELTRFDSLRRFRILRCAAGTGGVGGRQRERLPRKWVFLLAGSVKGMVFGLGVYLRVGESIGCSGVCWVGERDSGFGCI